MESGEVNSDAASALFTLVCFGECSPDHGDGIGGHGVSDAFLAGFAGFGSGVMAGEPAGVFEAFENLVDLAAGVVGGGHDAVSPLRFGQVGKEQLEDAFDGGGDSDRAACHVDYLI